MIQIFLGLALLLIGVLLVIIYVQRKMIKSLNKIIISECKPFEQRIFPESNIDSFS